MFDASPRPDLLALLAAVKAEPDDDTAKLVLADWLEEQDHEADRARGEYLRAFVAHSHTPGDDLAGFELVSRMKRLWEHYHPAWLGPLPVAGFRFRDFHHTAKWGLLYPSIDGVQLVAKPAAEVVGSEAYAWVAGLRFDRLSSAQLVKFAKSPLLDSLTGLSLHYCSANAVAITALVESPRATGLKYLDLEQVPSPPAAIAQSPHMARLRTLRFSAARVGDAGFKALCDSPHLNELRTLSVTSPDTLTIHSARAFADATGLPALTELTLADNHIGPDGTLILVASANAGRLRKLSLRWSNIGDYGAEAICNQPHLDKLTHLDLPGTGLTNRGAVAIAAAARLCTLEELNLSGNAIGGMGAGVLANSPHLANLRRLDLSGNAVGERTAELLRERFGTRVVLG